MYFINKGNVILIDNSSLTFIHELQQMDHFGEISFFLDVPRICAAWTNTFTELLFLKRENFLEALGEYPDSL